MVGDVENQARRLLNDVVSTVALTLPVDWTDPGGATFLLVKGRPGIRQHLCVAARHDACDHHLPEITGTAMLVPDEPVGVPVAGPSD